MRVPPHYLLPLDLQLKWLEAARAYRREWVAGLRLEGDVLTWFGFKLGEEHEVEFIDIKDVLGAVGTVHFHPHEHSETPIPSIDDGLNWIYLSYWQISDDLNPIFFIVFRDGYASWAMFPKPPIVRDVWMEEFKRLGREWEREDEASWNTCIKLLKKGLIRAGVFRLGEEVKKFPTF